MKIDLITCGIVDPLESEIAHGGVGHPMLSRPLQNALPGKVRKDGRRGRSKNAFDHLLHVLASVSDVPILIVAEQVR